MSLESRLIGGRYEIVRKIAEGGMGAVYEAKHNLSKKSVALKVLFEHIGKDEAARQRFLREVSAPAQIGHDGIVEVYDAGFDIEDGSLFVAMELLDGDPMSDRLARGGLPLDTLLDWFEQILDPLSAAHAKGIVHRDLKPENVFMATKRDGSEVVKILDFGIARDLDASKGNVTQTGIAMGTPHYMAPEQAMSARDVTAAADVWAIGAMMYEALAGRPPFGGETASAIVVNACTKQHEPLAQLAPSVPPALGALVDRCLSKEPRDRPSDAGALLGELRRVRGEIGSVSGLAAGGFASGLPATGAPPGPTGALATGPLGGSSPHGTARVGPGTPAPGAHGTPQPGSFGSSPGQGTGPGGPLGYGTPPPGSGPGAPGYGTSPPGYGTSQPGYGTSQPGFGTGAPHGGFAPVAASTGGGGKGGLAIGIVAAVLLGGVVLVGGGIAGAIFLLDQESDDGGTQAGSIGTVRIQTDVAAGELFVDGTSRGPVVPGQVFRLSRGSHDLEIRERGAVVATSRVVITPNQEQAVAMNRTAQPPPSGGQAMMPGNVQTFTGALRPGDETLRSGEYADSYYFEWTAGTQIRLEADSNDFDTYLILKAPSGAQRDNDDREPGNLNAAMDATIQETGRWQVMVTSFSSGETGDYTLTVRGP